MYEKYWLWQLQLYMCGNNNKQFENGRNEDHENELLDMTNGSINSLLKSNQRIVRIVLGAKYYGVVMGY